MSRPKTLGGLVERVPGDPHTFSAGVVWGGMPFLTGVERGATPEAAVRALEGGLRRLGYEPTVAVFDNLEDAQAEGRRRLAAEDLVRHLELARAKLPEVLAGEAGDTDARDREVLDGLDRTLVAVRSVADGGYDHEKREAEAAVRER